MRLKNALLVATAVFCIAGVTGCGASDGSSSTGTSSKVSSEATSSEASSEASSEGSEAASSEGTGYSLVYDGATVKVGDVFEDIKESLGKETQPSEEIEPCDPDAALTTMYYYEGFTISVTDDDGLVAFINVGEGSDKVSTDKGIKVGDTMDRVKEVYGEPDNETEYVMQYTIDGKYDVSFSKADDGKTISTMYIAFVE